LNTDYTDETDFHGSLFPFHLREFEGLFFKLGDVFSCLFHFCLDTKVEQKIKDGANRSASPSGQRHWSTPIVFGRL
jgi:hypothetical protein